MNKIILILIFFSSSSIFSMTQQDLNDQLALEVSSRKNKIEKIKKLLEEGADPNTKSGDKPVLFSCCDDDNFPIFEALIDKGADVNSKFENKLIIEYCLHRHSPKCFKKLIVKGANINSILKYCILHSSNWPELNILIDNSIDINTPIDNEGSNIAMYYFKYLNYRNNFDYHLKCFPIEFFERGLNVNAVDMYGNNLLHIILKQLNNLWRFEYSKIKELINYLFGKGINFRKPNNLGETPINLASQSGIPEIINLFSEYDDFIRERKLYDTNETDYQKAGRLYKKKNESCCTIM